MEPHHAPEVVDGQALTPDVVRDLDAGLVPDLQAASDKSLLQLLLLTAFMRLGRPCPTVGVKASGLDDRRPAQAHVASPGEARLRPIAQLPAEDKRLVSQVEHTHNSCEVVVEPRRPPAAPHRKHGATDDREALGSRCPDAAVPLQPARMCCLVVVEEADERRACGLDNHIARLGNAAAVLHEHLDRGGNTGHGFLEAPRRGLVVPGVDQEELVTWSKLARH
jgi:hypothetical protein